MPTLKAASFEERMIQSGMKKSVGRGGEDRGENEKGNLKDYSPHFVLFLLFLTIFFSFLHPLFYLKTSIKWCNSWGAEERALSRGRTWSKANSRVEEWKAVEAKSVNDEREQAGMIISPFSSLSPSPLSFSFAVFF